VFYGISTGRVGEGHVVQDDPTARPGQSRDALVDRLGELSRLGVTMSSIPIPLLNGIGAYFDYTQWIVEEIMPAIA